MKKWILVMLIVCYAAVLGGWAYRYSVTSDLGGYKLMLFLACYVAAVPIGVFLLDRMMEHLPFRIEDEAEGEDITEPDDENEDEEDEEERDAGRRLQISLLCVTVLLAASAFLYRIGFPGHILKLYTTSFELQFWGIRIDLRDLFAVFAVFLAPLWIRMIFNNVRDLHGKAYAVTSAMIQVIALTVTETIMFFGMGWSWLIMMLIIHLTAIAAGIRYSLLLKEPSSKHMAVLFMMMYTIFSALILLGYLYTGGRHPGVYEADRDIVKAVFGQEPFYGVLMALLYTLFLCFAFEVVKKASGKECFIFYLSIWTYLCVKSVTGFMFGFGLIPQSFFLGLPWSTSTMMVADTAAVVMFVRCWVKNRYAHEIDLIIGKEYEEVDT